MAFPISPQAQIALLQQYADSRVINAGMVYLVASSSELRFDYDVLTRFISSSKTSVPKLVYLFLRIYVLAFIACKAYHWFEIMGVPIITNITTNILQCLRLNALYGRSSKVLAFLSLVFMGSLTAELYICVQYSINSTKGAGTVLPAPIPGCVPASIPVGFPAVIAWIPTVVAQGIFLVISVLHLFYLSDAVSPAITEVPPWKMLWKAGRGAPLVVWFVRDGAIFFFLFIMATYSFAVSQTYAGITHLYISHQGTRMVLNLRQNANGAYSSPTWGETFELQTHSIMFAGDGEGSEEEED
ncbi:hypothetical protein B0H11DRAFT_2009564 [Mycena galericulata]|nr:hypothetical protein B0H11DRAFT_2009564 [Mycena galericulata]